MEPSHENKNQNFKSWADVDLIFIAYILLFNIFERLKKFFPKNVSTEQMKFDSIFHSLLEHKCSQK